MFSGVTPVQLTKKEYLLVETLLQTEMEVSVNMPLDRIGSEVTAIEVGDLEGESGSFTRSEVEALLAKLDKLVVE